MLAFQQQNVINNLDLGFSEQQLQVRSINILEKEIRCPIPLGLCCGLVLWFKYIG